MEWHGTTCSRYSPPCYHLKRLLPIIHFNLFPYRTRTWYWAAFWKMDWWYILLMWCLLMAILAYCILKWLIECYLSTILSPIHFGWAPKWGKQYWNQQVAIMSIPEAQIFEQSIVAWYLLPTCIRGCVALVGDSAHGMHITIQRLQLPLPLLNKCAVTVTGKSR
jgi:hypothetical protein